MRLKIWRGLSPLAQRPAADTCALDRDVAALYAREAPRMRRRLTGRSGPDLASDLVQTAFVRLLGLGGEAIGRIAQPRSYLHRIADNLANDDAKSARRRAEPFTVAADDCELADLDLQAQLEARDLLRRVEQAIARLPGRTREIFLAHRFEDLTYPEIAERMDVSVATVEKHISSALRHLRRAVGDARD